ncbi:MAG: hypothetical protein PVG22_08455 [Chromatiales bacterium]|jgi:uncharacterized protein involved in response to NO
MCITLPSSPRNDRKLTPNSRLWAWLIDTPLRLLSAGGLVALGLAGLALFWLPDAAVGWCWFNLLYGINVFLLFGLLLKSYPRWLHVSPVRYARFGLIFFLLVSAQLMFYFGIGWFDTPGILYLLPLLSAWGITLSTFRGMQILAPRDPLRVRGLQVMLQLMVVGLLLDLVGLWFGLSELIGFSLWFGAALQLLVLFLILIPEHSEQAGTPHPLH